jgi:hypothetical protein
MLALACQILLAFVCASGATPTAAPVTTRDLVVQENTIGQCDDQGTYSTKNGLNFTMYCGQRNPNNGAPRLVLASRRNSQLTNARRIHKPARKLRLVVHTHVRRLPRALLTFCGRRRRLLRRSLDRRWRTLLVKKQQCFDIGPKTRHWIGLCPRQSESNERLRHCMYGRGLPETCWCRWHRLHHELQSGVSRRDTMLRRRRVSLP